MQITELNHACVLSLLPDRKADTHKGNYGKILLLCGSRGFTGAAYLAAMGALRSGAGLVYLGVPESIYQIEAVKLNEAIVFPLPETDGRLNCSALPEILERLPKMDAVLIGCGLGQSGEIRKIVQTVLEKAVCPVVVDADGINVLSGHIDMVRGRVYPTVLTPHDVEFSRLGGVLDRDRMGSAAELAKDLNAVIVLKGSRTCITDGITAYRNPTGNPGMAVGGSGDLLAGIIVSLLGQGLDPLTAAAVAVWLHGASGDLCAEDLGQYGMLPTDMLEKLPRLMK